MAVEWRMTTLSDLCDMIVREEEAIQLAGAAPFWAPSADECRRPGPIPAEAARAARRVRRSQARTFLICSAWLLREGIDAAALPKGAARMNWQAKCEFEARDAAASARRLGDPIEAAAIPFEALPPRAQDWRIAWAARLIGKVDELIGLPALAPLVFP